MANKTFEQSCCGFPGPTLRRVFLWCGIYHIRVSLGAPVLTGVLIQGITKHCEHKSICMHEQHIYMILQLDHLQTPALPIPVVAGDVGAAAYLVFGLT